MTPGTMIRPIAALATLAMLASSAVAHAAEPASSDPADRASLFARLDANTDGVLTTDEIPADRKSLFERLLRIGDKDDDGKLDAEEFAAALTARSDRDDTPSESRTSERPSRKGRPDPGRLFERLDANGDGKVELDEVPEPARERFGRLLARVDKDGDGAVTRREFAAAAPRTGAPARNRAQDGRDGRQVFQRMDRNGDGKVTADEVAEPRRPMFERLLERGDKDGDHALSLREFAAAFSRRRPDSPRATTEAARRRNAAAGAGRRVPPGLFGAIDANRDGQLDSAEIAAAAEAIRKLDRDDDGTVTAREIIAAARRDRKQQDQ